MSSRSASTDYGIDAPGLVRGFALVAIGATVALVLIAELVPSGAWWRIIFFALAGMVVCYAAGMAGFMIFESKIGKVWGRERWLDEVAWRGNERVLDIGCGRGLMLVGAARRLTTGSAIGVDIWTASDQSGNRPQAALDNAAREGVADRVEVATADMRALPFPDGSFDVIVSHWVVHNLPIVTERDLALSEMVRVLKPGGTIILADIANRASYAARLDALGCARQTLIVAPVRDAILTAVSFGSFMPFALIARRGHQP